MQLGTGYAEKEDGEVKMKHPEYDSPFELVVSDIATQAARNIDEMSWQAVQRVGIDVNKEKLLSALNQDSERYRKAYKNGYDTGYEKRDEEIIRCKDCIHWSEEYDHNCMIRQGWFSVNPDYFCASGERKEGQ